MTPPKRTSRNCWGEKRLFSQAQKSEAIYEYHQADGRLAFQKLRFPGKKFVTRKPNGKGGWEYKLDAGVKPLYRLPELLTANYVFICEGEKRPTTFALST